MKSVKADSKTCPVCAQTFKTAAGRCLHITKTMLPDHVAWKQENGWGNGAVNRGYRG